MTGAYFVPTYVGAESARYRSDPMTAGPWAADQQHGGPPSALAVHCAERVAAGLNAGTGGDGGGTGTGGFRALRTAAEFLAPVPVADLEVRCRVLRQARSAVLVGVAVAANDRDCLYARVWLLRDRDTRAVAAAPDALCVPEPGPHDEPSLRFPWQQSVEWRAAHDVFGTPGPAAVWARPRHDLVPGLAADGLVAAALIGDVASGVSAELDWNQWSFANVDLDVHLARPMHGDWLRVDAATQVGSTGAALARATLSDVSGPIGATAQTLLVAPLAR